MCLPRCLEATALLRHKAGHLLTPQLADRLLGAQWSVPRDVKRIALGLLAAVRALRG